MTLDSVAVVSAFIREGKGRDCLWEGCNSFSPACQVIARGADRKIQSQAGVSQLARALLPKGKLLWKLAGQRKQTFRGDRSQPVVWGWEHGSQKLQN